MYLVCLWDHMSQPRQRIWHYPDDIFFLLGRYEKCMWAFSKVFDGFSTALLEELAAPNVLSCQATEWKEIYGEEKRNSRGFFFDLTQKKNSALNQRPYGTQNQQRSMSLNSGFRVLDSKVLKPLSQGLTKPRINKHLYCSIQGFRLIKVLKNQLVATN